jgi:hypothetical protein
MYLFLLLSLNLRWTISYRKLLQHLQQAKSKHIFRSEFKMQLRPILAATTLLASALAAPPLFTRKADWANWAWTIRDFTRNCTNPNICTYRFTVDTGNSTQACTIVDFATPATTHPWYNISCQQVHFTLHFLSYFFFSLG